MSTQPQHLHNVDSLFSELAQLQQDNPGQYRLVLQRVAIKALKGLKYDERKRMNEPEPDEFTKALIHLESIKPVDFKLYEAQKVAFEKQFGTLEPTRKQTP